MQLRDERLWLSLRCHRIPYEITALRRLMGQYSTREAELDDLLRRGVFVDLYKVVRGGLRASRPGYGLKELEAFPPLQGSAEIKEGGASIGAFEEWMITKDATILDQIAAYNREDCIATRLLRDWLLDRKTETLEAFGPLPTPEPGTPKPINPEAVQRAALRDSLHATGDPTCNLAAQLLDYHQRERKPVLWAFFDRQETSPGQLIEDAEAIGGSNPHDMSNHRSSRSSMSSASPPRSTSSARANACATPRRERALARSSTSTATAAS
jgi:hypothetical protein